LRSIVAAIRTTTWRAITSGVVAAELSSASAVQIAKFFLSALMALPFWLPIYPQVTTDTDWGDGKTST
jgi:hypothetical protein